MGLADRIQQQVLAVEALTIVQLMVLFRVKEKVVVVHMVVEVVLVLTVTVLLHHQEIVEIHQ
jgi:hypothetical protein